jgi:hypothetical protein
VPRALWLDASVRELSVTQSAKERLHGALLSLRSLMPILRLATTSMARRGTISAQQPRAQGYLPSTQPRAMLLTRDSIHILYKYMRDVFENAIVPQQHPCEGVAQCATRPAREARYTAGKST